MNEIICKSFKEYEERVLEAISMGHCCLYDGMDECKIKDTAGRIYIIKLRSKT